MIPVEIAEKFTNRIKQTQQPSIIFSSIGPINNK